MSFKKTVFCLLLAFSSFTCFAIDGYIVILGGELDNKLVSLKIPGTNFSQKTRVSVNKSIEIWKGFIFLDSSYFHHQLEVKVKGSKDLKISLREIKGFRFMYIWYYRKRLSYELHNKFLELM